MKTVGVFHAKTHLTQLLNAVSKGETIMITNRGKEIAMLVPPEKVEKASVESALKALSQLKEKLSKSKIKITLDDIKKMKESGRK